MWTLLLVGENLLQKEVIELKEATPGLMLCEKEFPTSCEVTAVEVLGNGKVHLYGPEIQYTTEEFDKLCGEYR